MEAEGESELATEVAVGPVTTETVCFTVQNLPDPTPITVTGTLQYSRSYDENTRVLLMLHGGASSREAWDGGVRQHPQISVGKRMAVLGYAVVAIDRVGHGDSPYLVPMSGYRISTFSQAEFLHQVVTQLKAGQYLRTSGACPSGQPAGIPARSVVVAGHSVSGGIATQYAARHHDIDGLISLGWQNQGLTATAGMLIQQNVLPACSSGQGYTSPFRPGDSGTSAQCLLARWYAPNANPDDMAADCANENLGASPCAEFGSVPAMQAANRDMLPLVGPLSVLLAFMEYDNMAGAPGYHGPSGAEPDLASSEIAMWQTRCLGCDVETYVQPMANHAGMLHRNSADLSQAMYDWMTSRGLSPTVD